MNSAQLHSRSPRWCAILVLAATVSAAAGPLAAQFAQLDDSGGGLRLHQDGAADVALMGGLEITLGPDIVLPLDSALKSADGADLVERIERLVHAHARNDSTLAAAIGRYAVQRDPARHEMVSLGVLRGNPGASRLLLDNLGPMPGDPLQAAGVDRNGDGAVGLAAPGDAAVTDGAVTDGAVIAFSTSGGRGSTAGDSLERPGSGSFGGSATASSSGGTRGNGLGRFQAPRRSLFSPATAIVAPPPAGVASPSLP